MGLAVAHAAFDTAAVHSIRQLQDLVPKCHSDVLAPWPQRWPACIAQPDTLSSPQSCIHSMIDTCLLQ